MWQPNSRITRLIQNLALFSGSTTLAQFIMMVYFIILARVLGPSELGVFSSAYSLAMLSSFFLSLGMDTWLLRKAGMFNEVALISGSVLKIKAAIGLVWGAVLVIGAPIVRPDLYHLPLMLVCAIDIWSDISFNTVIQALNVQRRMKTVSWLMFLSRGGRLFGLLVLMSFGVNTAILFALTRCAASLAGLIAALAVHRPVFRRSEMVPTRDVISESMPFALSEFLAMIYTNVDITLIALMMGAREVGLYTPASGIIRALFVVPNAMFNMFVPSMTRLNEENPSRFRAHLRSLFIGYAGLGLAMWLAVWVVGQWMIPLLLGHEYDFTGRLLTILSPIMFLKSVGFACAVVIVAVGWQGKRLLPQLISAIINGAANVILIPAFGIIGVSWVYVASELVLTGGYLWLTARWRMKDRS